MIDQTDIHKKVRSENVHDRSEAVEQFHRYFALFQDKNQAWVDLLKLTKDKDINIQMKAIESIGLAFPYVSDKKQAWEDLQVLTYDIDYSVRWRVAEAIGLRKSSKRRSSKSSKLSIFIYS